MEWRSATRVYIRATGLSRVKVEGLDLGAGRLVIGLPMAAFSSSNGVPPGFRFHPTDEELLLYYLKKKVGFEKFDLEVIREVDLNKIEPWDLQGIVLGHVTFMASSFMHGDSVTCTQLVV
jgi:hypothetical protein